MSKSGYNTDLRVRVTEDKRKKIEKIAYERSGPGNDVAISDILREAIDEYLENLEESDHEESSQEQPTH